MAGGGDQYKWLVTGGAGFFGVHMCRGLVQRNQRVISHDTAVFPPEEFIDGLMTVNGDIRNTEQFRAHLKGVDYIVHAAAALSLADPLEIQSVNAEGTRLVLEAAAAAGVKRVVYIGTTAVYGMPKVHPLYEDSSLDPMGPYGIAKAQAERYCADAAGVETVRILRDLTG